MLTIESILYRSQLFCQLRSTIDMASPTQKLNPCPGRPPTATAAATETAVSATRKRSHRRRIRGPEPGSLNSVMREHAGTSLYVLPICWTDLHARLLNAHFAELDPILAPVPTLDASAKHQPRPSPVADALSRELTTLLNPEMTRPFCKTRAIKTVLSTFYPATMSRPKSAAELDLYFGKRVFRKAVRVPIVWKHPDSVTSSFDSAMTRPASSFGKVPSTNREDSCSSSWNCTSYNSQAWQNGPMLAYLNRTQLALIRANLFRIIPGPEDGDRANTPVANLQRLRSKMLIPENIDHDAHFVGILLAMAQAHFYEPGTRPSSRSASQTSKSSTDSSRPDFRDVKVQLLTHADDTAEFIVYTALVSAAFLERFASPSKLPKPEDGGPDNCGMKVDLVRVPVWPILGLKERLGKALGREIAGDIICDGDSVETWESQEDRQARLGGRGRSGSLKRTMGDREALSEVFNQSFESQPPEEACEKGSVSATVAGVPNAAASPLASASPSKRRRTLARSELEVC